MNKFTVLAKNKQTYFVKRLIEEVGEEFLEFVDPWSSSGKLHLTSLILTRTTGVYGGSEDLDFLRHRVSETRVINSRVALELFRSKCTQYNFFEKIGVPHIPWIDLLETSLERIKDFFQKFPSEKYLIKPHRGQGGWGIRLFTPDDFIYWYEQAQDREYVLQPYVQAQKELRFFFISDEWSLTLERFKTEGMAGANFGLNGQARCVTTPQELHEITRQVQSEVSLHYGAIDILLTENRMVVLEINAVPGIEQLEKVSGLNVMKLLIKSIKIN